MSSKQELKSWALKRVSLEAARAMAAALDMPEVSSRKHKKRELIDWMIENDSSQLEDSYAIELQALKTLETRELCGARHEWVPNWSCELEAEHADRWHRRGVSKWQ